MQIDTLIEHVKVFNSYEKVFKLANVAIKDGRFFYIGNKQTSYFQATHHVDGNGQFMVPGLIDIHLHIESTMVTPATFSKALIQNGVTTIVPEPHEMANVFGVDGVTEMIRASEQCEVDMFYSIPSSVPATSMETTGGAIEIEDIDHLMQTEKIICLGEIMNYVDVISEGDNKTKRLLQHMRANYPETIIEGHVPKLLDTDLHQMIYAGVDSDHTHQTIEGLKARIEAGMFIEIQEKSMTPEVIEYLSEQDVSEHFCFITDDVMADSLAERGHLNQIVKKAMQMGMAPEDVIYASTFTPAKRMRMHDRGVIAPGKIADFCLLSNLEQFELTAVYKTGELVNSEQNSDDVSRQFPEAFYESVKLAPLTDKDFQVHVDKENGTYPTRVMKVQDGSTFTAEVHENVDVHDGLLKWQETEHLLIATFERYGKGGSRAHGLITGDIIKHGAVATTYSHDNHNLLLVGENTEDMKMAANEVISMQGGICVVWEGKIQAKVPLPVGGILTEEPLEKLAKRVEELCRAMRELGYKHYNPIMSMSTLSLPVSPALKITDHGLIDVNAGKVVPLVMD
ncbi:adenine deaminase C-terminal domain-containing protein [Alkalicoccobacillus plakortidis]|uniref:Adenine deaminase n=1 Tax=Alkalicoccobacillus plakortidis TaxID=444060 RepID=A0ABT0XIN5_9BACI|nr:adenine deaminase C-terminal domain-containing protein [Alkalicoccobacillus plakortidis]MCM2675758.1 amidohydrolase family protein [Alkalicoccobacillus plakortidis]